MMLSTDRPPPSVTISDLPRIGTAVPSAERHGRGQGRVAKANARPISTTASARSEETARAPPAPPPLSLQRQKSTASARGPGQVPMSWAGPEHGQQGIDAADSGHGHPPGWVEGALAADAACAIATARGPPGAGDQGRSDDQMWPTSGRAGSPARFTSWASHRHAEVLGVAAVSPGAPGRRRRDRRHGRGRRGVAVGISVGVGRRLGAGRRRLEEALGPAGDAQAVLLVRRGASPARSWARARRAWAPPNQRQRDGGGGRPSPR